MKNHSDWKEFGIRPTHKSGLISKFLNLVVSLKKMCQITQLNMEKLRIVIWHIFLINQPNWKNFLRLNHLYPRKIKDSLKLLQQERFTTKYHVCTTSEKHIWKKKLVICHLSDQCALCSCTGPTMTWSWVLTISLFDQVFFWKVIVFKSLGELLT